jgi:hypothetical protein
MERACSAVGHADRERTVHRLGEPDRLGLVLDRLGESAELGQAHHQPPAIPDRCRRGDADEILVDPVGGQGREVIDGQLGRLLVLTPEVVRLLEIARGEDAESQVPEARGDLQCAGASRERLVQLAEIVVDIRHERADLPSSAIVVQPLGEGLGLAQALQRSPAFTERAAQHRPQLESDVEGLLQCGLALRQRLEGT